ncbi:MAG: glycosyltransferase family 2 protein [Acidobacteria bacterium]|nr:glycosyltransferase family 2 protein [Acidobacteriota bacterium]MBS1865020.1 glycosyltransferase family 2 protein [Acidobacteriota bacterium]
MKPLVSILIPAYNAENLIAQTLQSAVSQTWERKEIIVVDDGSKDKTVEVAQRFAAKNVLIVKTENQGQSAAVNHAYSLCQGDYIQELDADDILALDKIERQMLALRPSDSKRTLLSSPWAYFYHRTSQAQFVRNALWDDLTPTEWLIRKLGLNLHMQNATYLVSRELADAAGPWDITLNFDQDGDYFCRVLMASEGTRFVPEARVFYRASGSNRISFIGNSNRKKESLLRSMKFHVKSLRSLEESDRVRAACLTYLQTWYENFYPDQLVMMKELQALAADLGGELQEPALRGKYAWMKPIFGWNVAKRAQSMLPEWKGDLLKRWDKVMFNREASKSNN